MLLTSVPLSATSPLAMCCHAKHISHIAHMKIAAAFLAVYGERYRAGRGIDPDAAHTIRVYPIAPSATLSMILPRYPSFAR